MHTKTIDVEESRRNRAGSKTEEEPRLVKRAKLIITLKRSANFAENMKKSAEIKEENEKYIELERGQRDSKTETPKEK